MKIADFHGIWFIFFYFVSFCNSFRRHTTETGNFAKRLLCPTYDIKRLLLNPKKYLYSLTKIADHLLNRSTKLQNSKVERRLHHSKSVRISQQSSVHTPDSIVDLDCFLPAGMDDIIRYNLPCSLRVSVGEL